MTKKATALLALLALIGLLPAAAQEPQQEMTEKAEKMVEEAKEMVEEGEQVAEEAMEKAAEMAGEAAEKAEQAVEEAEEAVEEAVLMEADLSLEEVLGSHYEALGGVDAWKAVESVRFTGSTTVGPGMKAPFTMTLKRPGNIRLEFVFQGMTGIQASDGSTAWMVMPFMGKTDPEEMSADLAQIINQQSDLEGPLFDWAAKGHTVELMGVTELEGTEVYKVKVTRDTGEVEYHHLDKEYFVAIQVESTRNVQGQEMDIETAIGDYKELCLATSTPVDEENPCEGDSLWLAYSIESKTKGAPSPMQVITIEDVAVNPDDIAADFFAMPAKAPDESPEAEPAEPGE